MWYKNLLRIPEDIYKTIGLGFSSAEVHQLEKGGRPLIVRNHIHNLFLAPV